MQFTATELCTIIEAINKTSIDRFEYGGILIQQNLGNLLRDKPRLEVDISDSFIQNESGEVKPNNKQDEFLLTEDQKFNLRELELERMQIEDPLGYEQAIIDSMIKVQV